MSKIEELPADPAIEEVESETEEIPEGSTVTVYSRTEKKARKALIKLGLVKVEGITRVVLRRGQELNYVIAQPEVYRAGSSTYIVFGEAKTEDYSALARQAQAQAGAGPSAADLAAATEASGLSADDLSALASKDPAAITADLEAAAAAGGFKKDDAPVDDATDAELEAAGIGAEDLAVIKGQTNASNGAILKAYKENNEDIINTIVSLTS